MPSPRARRRVLGPTLVAALMTVAATLVWSSIGARSEAAGGHVVPGNFTGMGFDKCSAASIRAMDAWRKADENPYRAVGVYISGDLRACSQANLTPDWISHVVATGWHVMPLTVGPQASCSGFRERIGASPTKTYAKARAQGRAQADDAVAAANGLGIARGSTLFYDMEGWHTGYDRCDASTLWFLSAWSNRLHARGYAAGVYSSAASGIWLLDRVADTVLDGEGPSGFVLPDQVWFAQWNDVESTATSWIDPDHWADHQRIHQFYGGHNARNGGVTMNIDSNWLDVRTRAVPKPIPGPGSQAKPAPTPQPTPTPEPTPTQTPTPEPTPTKTAKPTPSPTTTPTPTTTPSANRVSCARDRVTRTDYPATSATRNRKLIGPLQCLLRGRGLYKAEPTGTWNRATTRAVHAFQKRAGLRTSSTVSRSTWAALLSAGSGHPTLRIGDSRPRTAVVDLARALNAAVGAGLHGTGYFGKKTRAAVKTYQRRALGHASGVVGPKTWRALHAGVLRRTTDASDARADRSTSKPKDLRKNARSAAPSDGQADAPAEPQRDTAAGIEPPVREGAPERPASLRHRVPKLEPEAGAGQAGDPQAGSPKADGPITLSAPVGKARPAEAAPRLSPYLLHRVDHVFADLDSTLRQMVGALTYWMF